METKILNQLEEDGFFLVRKNDDGSLWLASSCGIDVCTTLTKKDTKELIKELQFLVK